MLLTGPAAVDSRPFDEVDEYDLFMAPMAEYPRLAFTMNAVRRAGERLATDIVIDDDTAREDRAEILETFAVAHSWRDSHVYPMRSLRFSVAHKMKAGRTKGFTAARPKRMSSIRKKLSRFSVKLDQINDLGGCRAVLDNIEGVRSVIKACHEEFPHRLRKEYPYIDEPKPDGYRSHHMVFDFCGKGLNEAFTGRRVELQIRTRLQHSWATAVEAVGLYRAEDMKAGQGDADWLRLFALMSCEFAHAENCPTDGTMPARSDRIKEIRELNKKIKASNVLEDIKNVTHFSENFVHVSERSRYYLLRYAKDHSVRVESYWSLMAGAANLREIERQIELGNDDQKAVLVEVDKVEKLVEAYPNYFGDVSLFIRNLRHVCDGQQAIEYHMAPQKVVAPKPYEKPDYGWLKRRFSWK